MSQALNILKYLREGNDITTLEAFEKFGCCYLTCRIRDLKEMGVPIQSQEIKTKSGKYIKKYWLGA